MDQQTLINLLSSQTFRISAAACRQAGISFIDARLLCWLLVQDRSNAEMFSNFGPKVSHAAQRQGYIQEIGETSPIIWKASEAGKRKIEELVGYL